MVEGGSPLPDYKRLQQSLEDTLRTVVVGNSAAPADEALPLLQQMLPDAFQAEASAQKAPSTVWAMSCLGSAMRKLCVDVASEAAKHGQPPLQYAARAGAAPTLPRLLAVAVACTDRSAVETNHILAMLDDLQDVSVAEHTLDIITWLEQHRAWLAKLGVKASTQLTRLCNAMFKRMGRHDVVNKARLLLLTASCNPLFDRSGVNVAGALAPADPPPIEDVPEDAVDSAGKPVNVALYQTFWSLQKLLQDPVAVLKVGDNWSTFRKGLAAVLTELARSPATVAAVRTSDAPAGAAADATAQANDVGSGGGGSGGGQGATQCYLSSYKLFGLQLADSSFRRGFLVQVLIMLRCLLLPGKQPSETLKPKHRMEALELEKQVYAVLDATPARGKDFSRAVRDVLEREATWVEWKKGGKGFVVPGSAAAPDGAASSAAPKKAGAGGGQQGCADWSKPALAPMAAAVAAAREGAARKRKAAAEARAEGLALQAEVAQLGRVYDRQGEPFEDPRYKRNRYIKLLGGPEASGLTSWCQDAAAAALAGAAPPLLAGLAADQQPRYPLPRALCGQLLREMDPEAGIEEGYKRVAEDPVYRWRIGRAVAQELPEYEGSLITPDGLEQAMVAMMPQAVPPAYMAKYEEEAARKAAARGGKGRPGAAPAGAKGGGKAAAAAAAAAGDAADAAAGVVVKQEEQQEQQPEEEEAPPAAAAANGHDAAAGDAEAGEAEADVGAADGEAAPAADAGGDDDAAAAAEAGLQGMDVDQ